MAKLPICAAILLTIFGGCSANTPNSPAASLAPFTTGAMGGSATIHLVWPCYLGGMLFPDSLNPDWKVLLDGKQIGVITAVCHQQQFAVPAGRHTVRLADPFIDFGGLFPLNEQFALPNGEHLYLIVKPRGGNGGVDLIEISAARGKEEIAAVGSH